MQYELFGYRRDNLFKFENQIAKYYDILNETEKQAQAIEESLKSQKDNYKCFIVS
mgnify:CR=1 FL=1